MSKVLEEYANQAGEIFIPPKGAMFDLVIEAARTTVRETIEQLCPTPDDIHLEVQWIKDADFNAFACSNSEGHLIGINLGTRNRLQTLFDRFLSNPDCLPDLGNADVEVRHQNKEAYGVHPDRKYEPKCPIRSHYAVLMANLGFYFIVLHELGHIMNGHTRWVENERKISVIDENAFAQSGRITKLDFLTLEMDADSFACCHLLCLMFRPQRDQSSERLIFSSRTDLGDASETMILFCVVILAIFRFKSEHRIYFLNEILRQDHPPDFYRRGYCSATLLAFNDEYSVMEDAKLKACLEYATETIERHFYAEAPYEAYDVEESLAVGELVLEKLGENWKLLRPKLDGLKLGGNLAP